VTRCQSVTPAWMGRLWATSARALDTVTDGERSRRASAPAADHAHAHKFRSLVGPTAAFPSFLRSDGPARGGSHFTHEWSTP
jgi:hypothetical protein